MEKPTLLMWKAGGWQGGFLGAMRKRHDRSFKARVALEAIKGERPMSVLRISRPYSKTPTISIPIDAIRSRLIPFGPKRRDQNVSKTDRMLGAFLEVGLERGNFLPHFSTGPPPKPNPERFSSRPPACLTGGRFLAMSRINP